jgi:hypothetical protein
MAEPDLIKIIDDEARELADTNHRRWADAFTGRDALVEDAVQRAAAGGRAALLAAGRPPADSAAWEYALAGLLLNDPSLPLAIERTRQPARTSLRRRDLETRLGSKHATPPPSPDNGEDRRTLTW